MMLSILVLVGGMILCLCTGGMFAWRGVVHGFMRKRIVIRGQIFEGSKAMAWGGMSLFWAAFCLAGIVAAAVLLARELSS